MLDWKKPLLIGVGWGLGTAVGLAVLVAGFLWYQSRPKPPRPWNATSIKAQYDDVDTEGDKNTVVFYYTLENVTDFDYRIENDHNMTMTARLQRQNKLAPFGESGKIDYPVFVPAKKRVRFPIQVDYVCPVREEKGNPNAEERKKHREAVEKFVVDDSTNLDGFDLLDETNRYEIIFPAGWKHSKP